ncbi:MAG: hypothetical protein O2973_09230 [Gemmatimonadetes bacterium]|nr:hypothetical protein [Gemmatimonadota bacterium]
MQLRESLTETNHTRHAIVVAAVALAACIAGILNDFVYDDVPLIVENLRLHSLTNAVEIVSQPYWPPPFIEQLYRPLAVLLLAVEWAVGAGNPVVFRLVSYALYVASAVAFFRLATMLLARHVAFAVALLFAVHPVHVEAAALGVNQGELIVGLSALLVAARYIERRRGGGLHAVDWAVMAAWYAAAVFTKENGFVLPALLVAAELTLFGSKGTSRPARALWPGYVAMAAVAAVALVVRHAVLSGLVGAAPAKALVGLSLGERAFTMLQVVPMWVRLLVWPQHLQADFGPNEIVLPTSVGLAELGGVAVIAAAFAVLLLARRQRPVAAFGIAWCAVALLPVSNLVPTGIMLAERTLFLPSAGFLLAAGALSEMVALQRGGRSVAVRRALVATLALLVALGLGRSANRHALWNSAHFVVAPRQP